MTVGELKKRLAAFKDDERVCLAGHGVFIDIGTVMYEIDEGQTEDDICVIYPHEEE